jgi:NADPH:quinone reductase-like Zn-dependent oxidoreductase
MKAFVLRGYGPPENLHLTEIDKPVPGEKEVLVRVRATSVQPYDWHHLRGEPFVARFMLSDTIGVRGPKISVLGADLAGQVEAIGAGVTAFQPGDEVFAMVKQGGFAEYACVAESELAPMPKSLSFEQAAAVPLAGLTALLAVRDEGRIRDGHRVLINGASGGVGTFAVQLAKAFGGEVTGVCSGRNLELVRSLGADHVIDYTRSDFTRTGRRYDLLVDIAGSRSAWACRRIMARDGSYVVVGGQPGRWVQPAGHVFAALAISLLVPHRVAGAEVYHATGNRERLTALAKLIDDGKVQPVIDRRYSFEEIPAAVRYVEEGHAPGKVVVAV